MNTTKRAKTLFGKTVACFLSIVMIAALLCTVPFDASAEQANKKVMDARSGVVQIQVWFVDPLDLTEVGLHVGSGFLINETTVVTCDHVATGFIDEFYDMWAKETNAATGGNRTAEEIKNNLEIRISVYRDVYVKATVRKSSSEMDYAILTLDESIQNRTPLKIRSSATLQQTEAVYALGFPADLDAITSQSTYTVDDVSVTSGSVTKVGNTDYEVPHEDPAFGFLGYKEYKNLNVVAHSARVTGGNSGGPLVDADGYVVGINSASSADRNLAVSSDQLIEVLDALGVDYTPAKAGSTPIVPDDEPDEPVATEPKADTGDKDTDKKDADEKEEDEGEGFFSNTTNVIMVAAGAVVLILVIVIVAVVSGGKKKKNVASAPAPAYAPPAPPAAPTYAPPAPVAPAAPAYQPAPQPVQRPMGAPAEAAGETTVLSQGAGETTVLSKKVSGGRLIRKANGEVIEINSEHFVIGRERKNVNYCIANNTSISRSHAKLLVKNGVTYIVDMGTANGTFVNGVKAEPRHEIQLNNGDKITLADEELEYQA